MKQHKNIQKYIFIITFICTAIAACQKDNIPPASYTDGIWFYTSAEDVEGSDVEEKLASAFTGSFSFYFHPGVEQDTFLLPDVRIMGDTKNYDRVFSMAVVDSSTAEENVHFKFINTVVPAGATSATPSLLLLNTADLSDKQVKLYLKLQPTIDFPAVMGNDTLSADDSFLFSTHYNLTFSNIVQSPPYWDTVPFLGTWSQVKFEFIYSTLGFYPGLVAVTSDEFSLYYGYYLRLRQALSDYNSAHPGAVLTDENNVAVYF